MILEQIISHKKVEVAERKKLHSLKEYMAKVEQLPPTRPFRESLRNPGQVQLIAEVKKASPSKGLICLYFDPVKIGQTYESSGAAAISVLTDKLFFQGSSEYLTKVRQATSIPVLRKDFIIDPYQVYEARLIGADAILLIMANLTDKKAKDLYKLAKGLGMDALVEVHTEEELKRALDIGANIVGINNRNLHTFKTNLATTFRLREMITDDDITVVSESGINTREDVLKLQQNGIHAMLVGESLMRAPVTEAKVRELLGYEG